MKKVLKKILSLLIITSILSGYIVVYGATTTSTGLDGYTSLREVDKGTFNEYRYKLTQQFLNIKQKFDVDGKLDSSSLINIKTLTEASYKYLPSDTLKNQLYKSNLLTAVERGIRYPNDESSYSALTKALGEYIDKVESKSITGNIEATPTSGNAPLTTSLRGRVTDPSGTEIPAYNYIWWVDRGGKRIVLGRKQSLSYTFTEEGNYSVFLDVVSSHKNSYGNTDVLSFSSKANIEVKEKVASLILKVNNTNLGNNDILKFNPDEAKYGLIFDATSSSPTGGAKFIRTDWDFGNGITKSYSYSPKMERIIYRSEGEYAVKLRLTTNEGKSIEKKFSIYVHKPVATIETDKEEGYQGDKITFTSNSTITQKNVTYSWKVIDIVKDKVVYDKEGTSFTYTFNNKGKFNVQLRTIDAAGDEDIDSKIIYINSRAPVVDVQVSTPFKNKPNYVLLDGSKTYDPDFADDGKLKYTWTVDGEKIQLENPNYDGSVGYYTFTSKGEHSIILEAVDPDDVSDIKKSRYTITSLLSVDFIIFPKVPRANSLIKFIADSKEANYYEWDFGDGMKNTSVENNITHTYKKSGDYSMTLKVKNVDGDTTSYTKSIYVGNADSPVANIDINLGNAQSPSLVDGECFGESAYVIDRTKAITFNAGNSINVDGNTDGLTYSWKIGYNNKYSTEASVNQKFDELGCFPVKLTVKGKNNKIDTREIWVKTENLLPTFNGLTITTNGDDKDPVVVSVKAENASDPDGVIQSYLWYYYTDSDSEPQDFRITNTPTTSFVIPKVTGTYYFVLVMKDSNGARVSSEDMSKDENGNMVEANRYFITLASDNINTPLIDLKVDNSSVGVGDDVNFTATVKNVLGENITDKVEYSWDFDGDGFYDEKSKGGKITHKFEESGELHTKVKASYKGVSNTRSITVNVANLLKADFDYISIGNKFIFIDKSIGKVDSRTWTMGDGTTLDTRDLFSYEYEGDKSIYRVSLKVSEGTKIDTKNLMVKKSSKNELLLNNSGINLFTYPEYSKEDKTITVENSTDPVVLYLGESKGDFKYYAIDYDTSVDSDLNGTKDDDVDNLNTDSYSNGGPVKVTLNNNKFQNVRIFLLDSDNKIVSSQDLKIVKNYIKEENIDLDSLSFSGVTDEQKMQIDELKDYVKKLPQESRLKAMKYVEALQSAWFDDREKTQVILDFEKYIDGLSFADKDNVINLLESFIVENDSDKSTRNMAMKVITGLIPKDDPNYKTIEDKLEQLKSGSLDQATAKKIGTEILELVKNISSISNEDKVTIKSQLQYLIYGKNIPTEVLNEVAKDDGIGTTLTNILKDIVIWFFGFVLLFVLIILGFFIYYKMTNKDENLGFQDFIIEKTSGGRSREKQSDILSSIDESIFSTDKEEKEIKEDKIEEKQETKVPTTEEKIPDWLAGTMNSFSSNGNENTQTEEKEVKEDLIENTQVEEKEEKSSIGEIPDWLMGNKSDSYTPPKIEIPEEKENIDEIFENNSEEIPEIKEEIPKQEELIENKPEIVKESKKEEKIPDWLSGSFTEEVAEEKKEEEAKKEKAEESIPDWLKDSLKDNSKEEEKR
ncbi:MAG: PKD domain-containing protein, partial [Candidatus Gracilibacteria bacterium]|nr:PKD domain-containing protein [Candidatus Gracilibacteria bacterium]